MSSTALQSPAPLPTSSASHYASLSPSSLTRQGYHASQPQQPYDRQQHQHPQHHPQAAPSSTAHMSHTDSPMSSRAAFSSPIVPSAAVNAVASIPDHHQPSPSASSERRRHAQTASASAPYNYPPRSSSNRHEQQASMSAATGASPGSSAARRATSERASTDSPRRHREPRTPSTASPREDSSSRRRQQQQQPQEYVTQSSSNSSRATAGPTRAHEPPSREASEILNAMVVSPDEVDIEREMTRLALSHNDPSAGMVAHADDIADTAAPPPVVPVNSGHREYAEESRRGGRSRQEHQTKREKHIKFGEYILGNTIGEGEFGKVKLGWKADRGVQVAIKLIKKDAVGSNPQRMAKIMREVNILRQLNHPNIVQLHKMEESEHHYGIVLEYASGGELFDYILNHRYLNDNAARRLFAQLISGVGYLHKKGIVHRDLKLENLLLDRNRNIIITDFGFANSFDPNEELTEDEEVHLSDRDWVQRMGFDRPRANGMRKADLMLTSCGSPCYAAPELVVSDSVYTGRKVDVWSCGVILYAMLAGYLPFDDDPKNPEGDNINLLYKYIVSTPLTFPEYVTHHARDLLRRILVPDPRKRADLFEVARHSWLSEYANLVEFMTSTTTSPSDIQNMTASADDMNENPMLGRSASVRETSKKAVPSPAIGAIGGLASKAGTIDLETEAPATKPPRDNKRNTLQVEYVAPSTQTQRGEPHAQAGSSTAGGGGGKTRARPSNQGPVVVMAATAASTAGDKPLPREPTAPKDAYAKTPRDSRRPPSAHRTTGAASALTTVPVYGSGSRPATGGSIMSTSSRMAPPTRASFGQPAPPTLAGTNVHGKIQQPKGSGARNYVISSPIANDATSIGRPSISASQRLAGAGPGYGEGNSSSSHGGHGGDGKGHRRSNTLGDITDKLLGRSGSIFGGKGRKRAEQRQSVMADKASRKYPPLSFSGNAVANMASGSVSGDEQPRASMDSSARQSRRSFSLALGKKRSGSIAGSQTSQEKQSKRFSILPTSWGKAKGISGSGTESQLDLPIQDPPPPTGRGGGEVEAGYGGPGAEGPHEDELYTHVSDPQQVAMAMSNSSVAMTLQQQEQQQRQQRQQRQSQPPRPTQAHHQRYGSAVEYDRQHLSGYAGNNNSGMNQPSALRDVADNGQRPSRIPAPQMAPGGTQNEDPRRASQSGRVVLQKNKRLEDAYDSDMYSKHDRSGTSGRARRVMDYFRRRSKAKGSET